MSDDDTWICFKSNGDYNDDKDENDAVCLMMTKIITCIAQGVY